MESKLFSMTGSTNLFVYEDLIGVREGGGRGIVKIRALRCQYTYLSM